MKVLYSYPEPAPGCKSCETGASAAKFCIECDPVCISSSFGPIPVLVQVGSTEEYVPLIQNGEPVVVDPAVNSKTLLFCKGNFCLDIPEGAEGLVCYEHFDCNVEALAAIAAAGIAPPTPLDPASIEALCACINTALEMTLNVEISPENKDLLAQCIAEALATTSLTVEISNVSDLAAAICDALAPKLEALGVTLTDAILAQTTALMAALVAQTETLCSKIEAQTETLEETLTELVDLITAFKTFCPTETCVSMVVNTNRNGWENPNSTNFTAGTTGATYGGSGTSLADFETELQSAGYTLSLEPIGVGNTSTLAVCGEPPITKISWTDASGVTTSTALEPVEGEDEKAEECALRVLGCLDQSILDTLQKLDCKEEVVCPAVATTLSLSDTNPRNLTQEENNALPQSSTVRNFLPWLPTNIVSGNFPTGQFSDPAPASALTGGFNDGAINSFRTRVFPLGLTVPEPCNGEIPEVCVNIKLKVTGSHTVPGGFSDLFIYLFSGPDTAPVVEQTISIAGASLIGTNIFDVSACADGVTADTLRIAIALQTLEGNNRVLTFEVDALQVVSKVKGCPVEASPVHDKCLTTAVQNLEVKFDELLAEIECMSQALKADCPECPEIEIQSVEFVDGGPAFFPITAQDEFVDIAVTAQALDPSGCLAANPDALIDIELSGLHSAGNGTHFGFLWITSTGVWTAYSASNTLAPNANVGAVGTSILAYGHQGEAGNTSNIRTLKLQMTAAEALAGFTITSGGFGAVNNSFDTLDNFNLTICGTPEGVCDDC